MTPREKLIEDSQYNSARTSEMTRYIAFGLLAIFYTALVSGEIKLSVYLSGLFGALAVALDYLHYLSGYVASEIAIHRHLDGWPRKSMWRRGRFFLFWAKQVVVIAGVIALITSVASTSAGVKSTPLHAAPTTEVYP